MWIFFPFRPVDFNCRQRKFPRRIENKTIFSFYSDRRPSPTRLRLFLTFVRSSGVVITGSGRVVRRSSVHGDTGVRLLWPVEAGGCAVRGEAVLRRRLVSGPVVRRRRHLLHTKKIIRKCPMKRHDTTIFSVHAWGRQAGKKHERTSEHSPASDFKKLRFYLFFFSVLFPIFRNGTLRAKWL